MTSRDGPPRNVQSLNHRLRNLAVVQGPSDKQRLENRLRRAVANTAISQMLPEGVIKGGTAMKLRIGEVGSRFTPDFDAARTPATGVEDYLEALEERLRAGWGGFSGRVVELDAAEPVGVPADYVMRPFDVKLEYAGRSFVTVRFELGHDEIGSTAAPDVVMSDQVRELFTMLGLPEPQPVPVLPVAHQVAQKLHACTGVTREGINDRAHDLVDLQLLYQEEGIDLPKTAATARRLFAARQSHPWPPTVRVHPSWPQLYSEAATGLAVRAAVADAVSWANELIARLDAQT